MKKQLLSTRARGRKMRICIWLVCLAMICCQLTVSPETV